MSAGVIFSSILLVTCLLLAQTGVAASPTEVLTARRAMQLKPYPSVVPRSNEPAGQLLVLRLYPEATNMRFALGALQGIVNREKPRLYLGIDKPLQYLEYHGGKITIRVEPDPWKIFERFKDQVKGIVVYDSSLDALANVAITYAGVEDLIPADPDLAATLSEKHGWKIVYDLRGRWKTRVEAYTWAYENLFPRCTHFAMVHYNNGYISPGNHGIAMEPQEQKLGCGVDYAVEFKMFVWHINSAAAPEEMALAQKLMESVPLYTPIFGRSSILDTYAEPAWVNYVAKYANLHIPFSAPNVSVLSGARIPDSDMRQKQFPARDLGPDKVYVAFTNSEHDNLEHVIGGGPPWHTVGMETDDPYRIWWSDPWRGRVPIGWPIGPLLCELAPTTLARFATTATENDHFMVALSGLCLSSIPDFGSEYPSEQDNLLAGYAKLTGEYMKRLGWTMVNPSGPPGNLRVFADNVPGLTCLFEGYGTPSGMTYDKANYLLNGVPVFHSQTGGIAGEGRTEPISVSYARRAKKIVDQIMEVKVTERPAFIHAWTVGWDYGPTILTMAAKQLPKDYVVVRPDEMAALFKKYKGKKAELKSVAPKPKPSGSVTETPAKNGLVIDTGRAKFEIAWGTTPECPIKQVMGIDGVWRGMGHLVIHNPKKLSAEKFQATRTLDTDLRKSYRLDYGYSNGESMAVTIDAYAGRPYLVMETRTTCADLPTWTFDTFPNFKPNLMLTDAGNKAGVVAEGVQAVGGLPWHKWMLLARKDGPERDAMGFIVFSWGDWTSGEVIYWCRPYEGYFEFYDQRAGVKKFAVAALDKDDSQEAMRIWKELNGK